MKDMVVKQAHQGQYNNLKAKVILQQEKFKQETE
jgi:hypothetical protein